MRERTTVQESYCPMNSSRRRFLLSLSTSAIAWPALGIGAEEKPKCAMGFGTYGLPGYTLPESIRLIAQTGFDSIEIVSMPGYHGAPDQIPKGRRSDLRKQIADSGLKLGTLMGVPRPDKDKTKQAENEKKFQKLLELAIDLSEDGERPLIQSVLGGGEWNEQKEFL